MSDNAEPTLIQVYNPSQLPLIDYRQVKPLQGDLKDLSETNYKKLTNTLKKRGFRVPLFVWHDRVSNNKYLMDGHQRQRVMMSINMQPYEVPFVLIEADTEQEAKAVLLEISSQYGTITQEGLDQFTAELEASELENTVFDALPTYSRETGNESTTKEDEAPEVSNEAAKSKVGEIYQLGRHRLMCGDSTDFGTVSDLMNGREADMLFTDPPYGIDIVGANGSVGGGTEGKYRPVLGDDNTKAAQESYKICTDLGIKNMIIWGANYFTDFLPPSSCWLIWDKQGGNHVTFADVELAWTSFGKPARLFTHIWDGFRRDSEQNEMRIHPTQKPVKLLADMLVDYSERDNTILDLFGGSGSTLIACEQLDRTCYMMELDPKYCDVIRKRYANFIGQDDWEGVTPVINKEPELESQPVPITRPPVTPVTTSPLPGEVKDIDNLPY